MIRLESYSTHRKETWDNNARVCFLQFRVGYSNERFINVSRLLKVPINAWVGSKHSAGHSPPKAGRNKQPNYGQIKPIFHVKETKREKLHGCSKEI